VESLNGAIAAERKACMSETRWTGPWDGRNGLADSVGALSANTCLLLTIRKISKKFVISMNRLRG